MFIGQDVVSLQRHFGLSMLASLITGYKYGRIFKVLPRQKRQYELAVLHLN